MLPAEAVVHESPVLSQLTPGKVHRNLSVPQMVAVSLARGEAKLAANGALVAYTSPRTGRSPKDKFIILDDHTRETVKWGKVNQPIEPEKFEALYHRVMAHLAKRDVYVQDLFAGADPHYQMPVQIISEYAWQALFVHQLFLRPTPEELATHVPEFTVIAAPEFEADPERDGTRSSTAILLDFTRRIVLIVGTKYAGEMKKCIFSVLNFLLPQRDVFPMHCSANVGEDGVTALFFGLSGTGKTTLSADPYRRLIGDDEHGWGPNGVFNFEGGCYAKCVDLSKEKEPQIYHAIRFGSVLENVVLDPESCEPDYHDIQFTENTRAAYPIDYIQNASDPQHWRPSQERFIFDRGRIWSSATYFKVDAGAGDVSLSVGIHGEAGGHGNGDGKRAGAGFLDMFRGTVYAVAAEGLRRHAWGTSAPTQCAMLAGEYGMDRRSVWRGQANWPAAHARHGACSAGRAAGGCGICG